MQQKSTLPYWQSRLHTSSPSLHMPRKNKQNLITTQKGRRRGCYCTFRGEKIAFKGAPFLERVHFLCIRKAFSYIVAPKFPLKLLQLCPLHQQTILLSSFELLALTLASVKFENLIIKLAETVEQLATESRHSKPPSTNTD